jgi:uncharacterized cofD-like protein
VKPLSPFKADLDKNLDSGFGASDGNTLKSQALAKINAKSPRDWRALQWLTIGIGIKRWGLIAALGLLLFATGMLLALAYVAVDLSVGMVEWIGGMTHQLVETERIGWFMIGAGVMLFLVGMRGTLQAVELALAPGSGGFLEAAIRRRKLEHGEELVALGGGTGLSTMLRGLKHYTSNITAIVTMADDGGSSGRLRKDGMLPPGDLRNCMAALADAEPEMQELFQHRFTGMGELEGHSLGNLIVAAMCERTGSFESAVRETSKVLSLRGSVLPSTVESIELGARLADGSEVMGQVKVHESEGIQEVFLKPDSPAALPGVLTAIAEAEVIIIGPGSLYTSILPNLLVPEIGEALKAAKAPKIYVCNVMTQAGETLGYKASDHVRAILRHIGKDAIDIALVNSAKIPEEVLERYRKTRADYVEADLAAIEMLGVRPIQGNFADVTDVVRHNPQKLAQAIFRIVAKL